MRGPRARPGSREPSEGRAPGRGSERRPWTVPRGGRATRHGGRRPGVPGGVAREEAEVAAVRGPRHPRHAQLRATRRPQLADNGSSL